MLHITKKDLDKYNYYKDSGINTTEEITCDENLGYIKFKKSVITTKSIILGLDCGIEAGCGIKAGDGIKAGWGIKAGDGIEAGFGIEAGCGIKAGCGIEAGYGIKAGCGIEAGYGIKAGLSIICKRILKFSYQLFSGTCTWRETKEEDLIISCGKLETDGKIILGNLIETGIPEEVEKIKIINGLKYRLVEDDNNVKEVA